MKESDRKGSSPVNDEVKHKLLQNFRKNIGPVDVQDMAALNTIAKEQRRKQSDKPYSPGDVIDITRSVLSDSGADPTEAIRELKERQKR